MIVNLDGIVRQSIHPLLKSLGFKKKGLRWNRERREFVDVVTVQRASYSTKDQVDFTVNLGVVVPEFQNILWPDSARPPWSEADCVVRVRLGELIQGKPFGGGIDQWWEVGDADLNAELIGKEIEGTLKNVGVPFLGQFDAFGSILEYLKQLKGRQGTYPLAIIHRALVEWKTGAIDAALATLATARGWEEKVDIARAVIRAE